MGGRGKGQGVTEERHEENPTKTFRPWRPNHPKQEKPNHLYSTHEDTSAIPHTRHMIRRSYAGLKQSVLPSPHPRTQRPLPAILLSFHLGSTCVADCGRVQTVPGYLDYGGVRLPGARSRIQPRKRAASCIYRESQAEETEPTGCTPGTSSKVPTRVP